MEKINIDNIKILINRKRIKNIYLSVNTLTGEANISAPYGASLAKIEGFVKTKLKWIKKHRAEISKKPPIVKNSYLTGEKIRLFGKEYELKVFEYKKKPRVFLNFDTIDLYIKADAEIAIKKEAIDIFYKEKLKEIVPEFIEKWSEKMNIKQKEGFFKYIDMIKKGLIKSQNGNIDSALLLAKPLQINYKRMKSRWGSCNISDKKITFNTELAKKTPRCIEYIAVHELLHLKERLHNKRFKDYMRKMFPDWKTLEAELKFIS